MARRPRPRRQFMFWLYKDIEEQRSLIEFVDYLRKTRQFAKVIRSGLRLMWTLGDGDLSVLFELFPSLRGQFKPDNSDLIEQFRQIMLQEIPKIVPTVVPMTGNLMSAPPPLMPTFDDEDTITLVKDTRSGEMAVTNFLDAALKFQEAQHEIE